MLANLKQEELTKGKRQNYNNETQKLTFTQLLEANL